jgi:putative oxidoreductase
MNTNKRITSADLGLLILRLGIGLLMFLHGYHKFVHGHDFIIKVLTEKGLPEFLWVGVPVAEVLAPLLIIFGVFTRISSALVVVVMAFSIYLAFGANAFVLTQHGGFTAEFNISFIFSGLALMLLGPGKLSLYKPSNPYLQ